MKTKLICALTIVATTSLMSFAKTASAETVTATVTAYNTVPAQTAGNPCEAASTDNICGRRDVVACPRNIPLGTWVKIKGKSYECLDRTAKKYDGRFDISFDKDVRAALRWGKQRVKVTVLGDS
jgi:3D (Asp-Asp-Asp) domain-containing protein